MGTSLPQNALVRFFCLELASHILGIQKQFIITNGWTTHVCDGVFKCVHAMLMDSTLQPGVIVSEASHILGI